MEAAKRREAILYALSHTQIPVSGTELAKQFGVSRQVIVQDIALLRAVNKNILSTTKGYILYCQEKQKVNRCFLVRHTTEQIEDELNTIIDCGGKILDVIISHEIYGQISADLMIASRQDVIEFVSKIQLKDTLPLKELTKDIHLHTVEADNEMILDKIEQALKEKKYLFYQ